MGRPEILWAEFVGVQYGRLHRGHFLCGLKLPESVQATCCHLCFFLFEPYFQKTAKDKTLYVQQHVSLKYFNTGNIIRNMETEKVNTG